MWYVPAEFPVEDIAEWLTEDEYRLYVKVCPMIKVDLHFEYTPEDGEVGFDLESFSWDGNWSLPSVGNYPSKVKDAISEYLCSVDVDGKWGSIAEQQADRYIDYATYQDIQ